ncbi:hypothetical protein ABGB18_40810 [Nonomuraea sp. B12E4]|uniref:hypothetical protein n=1 Tax=Nonomuraea sp. B12E4 TaxID=3153564 RepID=UPI00325DD6D6
MLVIDADAILPKGPGLRAPIDDNCDVIPMPTGRIERRRVLRGLINEYSRELIKSNAL